MAHERPKLLTLEGVELIFCNFSGRITAYNQNGDRDFCVVLPDDVAEELVREGWNVRTLAAREEGDVDRRYISVKVNYDRRPPRVVTIVGDSHHELSETNLGLLDSADITNVDLIINPSSWSVNGNSGIKAYLKTAYITIYESKLDRKYGF